MLEHFVWVTDEELSIFADSGAVASNDPGSNLRLSSGICRVRDIMDTGGRIAFGTDSGVYPHGTNAIQLGYQVRLGQTPAEAHGVLGFAFLFSPHALASGVHLGTQPSWRELAFAVPLIAVTSRAMRLPPGSSAICCESCESQAKRRFC